MNTMLFRRAAARCAVAAIALLFVAGASSRARAADLSGCWEGYWKSCTTGHQGVLRATITKVDDTRYCARFTGTFFKIIPFRYSTMLNAVDEGDVVRLSGSSYLGRIMGTFCYDGTATDCHFNMNYRSKNDCGVFRMCRVSCSCD